MNSRSSLKYLPIWLLIIALVAGLIIYVWADYAVDMATNYSPLWVWATSVSMSLLIVLYYLAPVRANPGAAAGALLLCVFGLMITLPRLVLLANVPDRASSPGLQELDVVYVQKEVNRSSFVGSQIGIRYRDSLLAFKSSRTTYFLLQHKRCIRADIGQAVPGFYYLRNLQLEPGARQGAFADYWRYWLRGAGTWAGYVAIFGLVAWIVSRIFRERLLKIRL